MSPGLTHNRPIRIGGASGGFSDRRHAIPRMARTAEVDVIVGDWLAEMTMTEHGVGKHRRLATGKSQDPKQLALADQLEDAQFSVNFLDCFEPAIPDLKRNKIKLAVNAGSCDTEILAHLVKQMCENAGHPMNVAWVEGDDVIDRIKELSANGEKFRSLNRGKDINLNAWGFEPISAQAYLGGLGIAEAFRQGADIVICGRVADAAPTVGAAAWWHGWNADNIHELAGALVAGHLIECSGYVTGANYSGFKKMLRANKHLDMGFPIAEVDYNGECVVTKEKDTGGLVDVGLVTSQLIYEIQGPLYYNSDVTADIENVQVEELEENRVRFWGVKGLPPPPTTKVGITANAGWQAEYHVFFVGLDMEEKARWTEEHVRESLGDMAEKLSLLKFHLNGTSPVDAPNQDAATVDFKIFAQGRDYEMFDMENPHSFGRKTMVCILESAPGASLSNDLRQIVPKPFQEYYVALFPQSSINHRVHLLYDDSRIIDIDAPKNTVTHPRQQKSYETSDPIDLSQFETVRAPLGHVVMGRSGDKATDANVGLFVRHDDEWDWLRTLLSTDKIKEMLRVEYKGKPIDRFELPHLKCVHFLLHDHLERGYSSTSTYDTLGKNVVEFLRATTVDVPKKFLDRGKI
ncbi:hypothetical protein EDD36DRAFT_208061 [Exophiala viscosa]|uniref:DUF1446 domain-containing protein n=1 Tax=Exophiala viscosa TaxID=2486360 RepID=A0AAN6IDU0_9EURO|nr:hypothetical protein EDD36DRAFT_208061 [Exophiala viscosa]